MVRFGKLRGEGHRAVILFDGERPEKQSPGQDFEHRPA
jgi:hypothetical protein